MADPNDIRLYPIDGNQILRLIDLNTIELLGDPFIPEGWKPNPGSTIVGGEDAAKDVGGSGGEFGTPDEGSGNR
jgi:hypothetical protein